MSFNREGKPDEIFMTEMEKCLMLNSEKRIERLGL